MAYGYVQPQGYRDPNDKYSANPQGNYAQESDFFKNNPYGGNPYEKITGNLTQQGNSYLNRNPTNPYGAGGPLSSGGNFGQAFGYSGYGDINSPWSKAQLGTHMANLRGGEQNLVDQYTRGAASGGVTSGRGGFGVSAGGAGPEAGLQQNAMRTLAEKYGSNYGQSMGYLKSSADSMDAQAGEMARLYGTIYGVNANTGANLMGQALQGTKYGADDQNAYMDKMFGAFRNDTGNTNRLREGEADNLYKRKMQQQGLTDAQFGRDQTAAGLSGLKSSLSQQTGKLGSAADWGWNAGMAPIYQQQAGITPGTFGALASPQRTAAQPSRGQAAGNPYAEALYQDQVRRSF